MLDVYVNDMGMFNRGANRVALLNIHRKKIKGTCDYSDSLSWMDEGEDGKSFLVFLREDLVGGLMSLSRSSGVRSLHPL